MREERALSWVSAVLFHLRFLSNYYVQAVFQAQGTKIPHGEDKGETDRKQTKINSDSNRMSLENFMLSKRRQRPKDVH